MSKPKKRKKSAAKFDLNDPKVKTYFIVGVAILAVVSIAIGLGAAS